jgi:hypothetical protein
VPVEHPARAENDAPTTVARLASVVRSKNAGPTVLTIDLFCPDDASFQRLEQSPSLSADAVARAYGLAAGQVQRYALPSIRAMKFTLPRRIVAGDPGDGDVYGAQQHLPMLTIAV